MKDIPIELLYLLFFAVVIVGQYLAQWFKREQEKQQTDAAMGTDRQSQSPEADELPFLQTAAPVQPAPPEPSEIPPHRSRPRGLVVAEQAPPRTRKRYSRDNLFGSRQHTQNAVVVATILGPCRAKAPYDNGQ